MQCWFILFIWILVNTNRKTWEKNVCTGVVCLFFQNPHEMGESLGQNFKHILSSWFSIFYPFQLICDTWHFFWKNKKLVCGTQRKNMRHPSGKLEQLNSISMINQENHNHCIKCIATNMIVICLTLLHNA